MLFWQADPGQPDSVGKIPALGVALDSVNWRVVVHLRTCNKIEYTIGPEDMANEYAMFILERGCDVTDERGVRTWFPVHMIHKVKVVPPGVELGSARDTARFI